MGERARFYRLLRRKTIRQLASECGCSPNTIWRLENGRCVPTLDTLRRVADALDVDWWDLWVNPLPEGPEDVPAIPGPRSSSPGQLSDNAKRRKNKKRGP